ncbi:MAG: EcsC family protein [Acetoanaerobium sp.]|nr:EcsC family protein [Acetoanaerobium sp.]
MSKELSRQFKRLNKKEEKILNKKKNKLIKSKVTPVMDKVQDKIPEKLKDTLESAFFKGFQLVFEKGNIVIEKTYNKDRLISDYEVNNYILDKNLNRKSINKLDKYARDSKRLNTSLSFIEGSVLGFFGVGLPDIPIFIGVIMKTIYEIALNYGYKYDGDEEKAFILKLIAAAMSEGEEKLRLNDEVSMLGDSIDKNLETNIDLDLLVKDTAKTLSDALLVGKFIQGIPLIGALGGTINYTIIKKIAKYAEVKYKKRYLAKKLLMNK